MVHAVSGDLVIHKLCIRLPLLFVIWYHKAQHLWRSRFAELIFWLRQLTKHQLT